jgi:2-polyprenyl-3-methyl-5-hydroxy-6-metoxy-1,4-benzoquinol methylase
MTSDYKDFGFTNSGGLCCAPYVLPQVMSLAEPMGLGPHVRVLDVGCDNGYFAGQFLARGCRVVGIDLSESGIDVARRAHPAGRFEVLAADAHVLANLGEPPFDLVISTEVVEHLYAPRPFMAGCVAALRPGGRFICSTPYNGKLKNIAVTLAGKFDHHFNPLWDGGHIKFWTRKTLGERMSEAGLTNIQFRGAGRAPLLWMSMVMSGDKPAAARTI